VSSELDRLIALCPPPLHPFGAGGDRSAARGACGWHVPYHVFDVIDAYGDARWMRILLIPSPYTPSGRLVIEQRRDDLPTLIGFTDPARTSLWIDAEGVVVLGPTEEHRTGKTLAAFLYGWLAGEAAYGLPAVDRVAGLRGGRPWVLPRWDPGRKSSLRVVRVQGGAASRAERWRAFSGGLGAFVHCGIVSEGETRQDRVYLPELEAELLFDSYAGPANEKLHVSSYEDRQPVLDARIDAALAAAGMARVVRGAAPAAPPTTKTKQGPKKTTRAPGKRRAKTAAGPGVIRDALERAVLPGDAWGAGRARGLGASRTIDRFLGLGFPHMIATTDDPELDFEAAQTLHGRSQSALLGSVVPRALVPRLYAVATAAPEPAKLKRAFEEPPAITLEAAIERAFRYGAPLFLLEAMFESLPVAEAIVAKLEHAPLASWREPLDRQGPPIIRALGWILHRVPAAARERLRAVLERTHERVTAAGSGDWRPARALDVVLHGRAGVERSGGRAANQPKGALFFSDLAFVGDDRAWLIDTVTAQLERMRPADREHFDPQLIVQAPELLEPFRASLKKFLVEVRPRTEAMLALFR
jgi:hypothetical protein